MTEQEDSYKDSYSLPESLASNGYFQSAECVSFYDELPSLFTDKNFQPQLSQDTLLPPLEDSMNLNNVLMPDLVESQNSEIYQDIPEHSEDILQLDLPQDILQFTSEEENQFNIFFGSI